MKIGCDIGGVIKDMGSDNEIPYAIETINELKNIGHEIIFISKCNNNYEIYLRNWLLKHNLNEFKVYFCLEYSNKKDICENNSIEIMIDDNQKVLNYFSDNNNNNNIHKIWYCDNDNIIRGTYKYQPEFMNQVKHIRHWTEIFDKIDEISNENSILKNINEK